MTSFKQHIEQFEQQERQISEQRQALSAAIQSAIADRVCADIGEQFRAHVIALPMQEQQSLHWRWLAGRSEELAETADAFGAAMVECGYLIRREMYRSGRNLEEDIELSQEDIEQCICPHREELVSRACFDYNRYQIWESTDKWLEMFKNIHEDDFDDESQSLLVGENLQKVIDYHANALETVSNYAYFELAYTRHTGWMVWVTSHQRTEHPSRQVLISGQGGSPEEACADALAGAAIEYNADQIVESLITSKDIEIERLKAQLEQIRAVNVDNTPADDPEPIAPNNTQELSQISQSDDIAVLKLNSGLHRSLKAKGINTVHDLIEQSETDLFITGGNLYRLKQCLKTHGFTLKEPQSTKDPAVQEDPKPCPKCGSDSVSVEYEDEGSVCEFVTCDDCGYQIKRRYAGNGVTYWNSLSRKKMPVTSQEQTA